MLRQILSTITILLVSLSACAVRQTGVNNMAAPSAQPVSLNIWGDTNGLLPTFPVDSPGAYRAYVQSTPDERYSVVVYNNSAQRVGLVIAVDGRNIISGKQSWLRNNERMYILEPHSSGRYEGWRTASDRVNRFYFTSANDSYSAAWGDTSAMGVVAMAVYPELDKQALNNALGAPFYSGSGHGRKIDKEVISNRSSNKSANAASGTGLGENYYSSAEYVSFRPDANPIEKVFLKYEWRATLCAKNILQDCQNHPQESNRFWPEDQGFVKLPR